MWLSCPWRDTVDTATEEEERRQLIETPLSPANKPTMIRSFFDNLKGSNSTEWEKSKKGLQVDLAKTNSAITVLVRERDDTLEHQQRVRHTISSAQLLLSQAMQEGDPALQGNLGRVRYYKHILDRAGEELRRVTQQLETQEVALSNEECIRSKYTKLIGEFTELIAKHDRDAKMSEALKRNRIGLSAWVLAKTADDVRDEVQGMEEDHETGLARYVEPAAKHVPEPPAAVAVQQQQVVVVQEEEEEEQSILKTIRTVAREEPAQQQQQQLKGFRPKKKNKNKEDRKVVFG